MGKTIKLFGIVALGLILLSAGCAGFTPASRVTAAIGSPAPDFTLQTLDGRTISLSGLKGSPVLVNFWATWCRPCREEMPYLQEVHEKYSDKGLVLLAVDIEEDPETVRKFMTELNLSMTAPLDTDGKVAKAYGLTGVPETFLIDKNGIIRQKIIGAFPNTQAIEAELTKIMP